jgi:hypothetical protein
MVYALAMKKTAGFMFVAMMLSLSIILFMSGDTGTPSGQVTGNGAFEYTSGMWVIFMLGIFVSLLLIGAYVYISNNEPPQKA